MKKIVLLASAMTLLPFLARAQDNNNDSLLQQPFQTVKLYYPKDGGAVFSIPKVIVIYKIAGPLSVHSEDPDALKIYIDNKQVPQNALTGCSICAGPKPAVSAKRVRWALTEGPHTIHILATDKLGRKYFLESEYVMDSSIPSLSGLSGAIFYPNAELSASKSLRGGLSHTRLKNANAKVWLGVTHLLETEAGEFWAHPFEFSVSVLLPKTAGQTQEVKYSGKLQLFQQKAPLPSLGMGNVENSPFIAASWHTKPNFVIGTIGYKTKPESAGFATLEYGKHLWKLLAEADTEGNVNGGVVLAHPYGLRIGLYTVKDQEENKRLGVIQLSGSLGLN